MNTAAKFGLAAAAIVVAALLGLNYLVAPNIGGPRLGDPSPTPSPTPTVPPATGQLEPGTYYIDSPAVTPVRFTFTVPAGWSSRPGDFYVSKHSDEPGELGLFSWIVTHVYADACESEGTLTAVGPTVDDLISALADQAGSETSEPIDLTLGGYPARRVDVSAAADVDPSICRNDGLLQIWANPAETSFNVISAEERGTLSIYVVDVDGERAVITTGFSSESSAAVIAELEAIVDSIAFEP